MTEMPKKQYSLLLVDHSSDDLNILASVLQGYHLLTATTGLQALEIANRLQPDLILLGICMPGLDGFEICKRLKEDTKTQHIPVIFVTSLTQEKDETQGFSVGAVDYITKPIRPSILQARVAAQLKFKTNRDQLTLTAYTDILTGIPNRRHFENVMQNEWNRALRHNNPLSLIIADVDYFKQFNDTYGHAAGDDCLRAIANNLNHSLRRSSDMVARLGGEEFVCLLPEVNQEQSLKLAERILYNIRNMRLAHEGSSIAKHVTLSLGLATLDLNKHNTWQDLLHQADQALYKAKDEGRNCLVA
jgi:diguanylate cyclase (GGDEF)-like protein